MFPPPFRVVLDANVLYPFTSRDTLLRAAAEGWYQPYWSARILDEAVRNLVANRVMTEEQARHLLDQMALAFPEAMVTGHEPLIPAMPNHEKDRHVAAAAVHVGAQVIVTNNLTDFRPLPGGVEVQSADEFLSNLFDLQPHDMVALLREQAADMRKRPCTFEQLLAALAKMAPSFVEAVQEHLRQRG